MAAHDATISSCVLAVTLEQLSDIALAITNQVNNQKIQAAL